MNLSSDFNRSIQHSGCRASCKEINLAV